jgi:hypothetical protein
VPWWSKQREDTGNRKEDIDRGTERGEGRRVARRARPKVSLLRPSPCALQRARRQCGRKETMRTGIDGASEQAEDCDCRQSVSQSVSQVLLRRQWNTSGSRIVRWSARFVQSAHQNMLLLGAAAVRHVLRSDRRNLRSQNSNFARVFSLRALGQDESVLRPAPAANCRAALVAGANQSARRQCRGGQSPPKRRSLLAKLLTLLTVLPRRVRPARPRPLRHRVPQLPLVRFAGIVSVPRETSNGHG